jgi:hypothetical protein
VSSSLSRYQLVYAHGTATQLPAVIDRAVVAQALLRLVSGNVEEWLDKRSAVWDNARRRYDRSSCHESVAEDAAKK